MKLNRAYPKPKSKPGPLIAHRGASAYAPENTLVALELAHTMGAGWVECDLMLSRDHHGFIFHDERLERLTGRSGFFKDMPQDLLQSLEVGAWFSPQYTGTPILSLVTLFEFCQRTGMGLNLELKPTPGRELALVELLLNVLNTVTPEPSFPLMLSSFEPSILVLVQELCPLIPRAYLTEHLTPSAVECSLTLGCCAIHTHFTQVTLEQVNAVHVAELWMGVYTVNEAPLACHLLEQGIDYCFSDYPNLLDKKDGI